MQYLFLLLNFQQTFASFFSSAGSLFLIVWVLPDTGKQKLYASENDCNHCRSAPFYLIRKSTVIRCLNPANGLE
jgi:hypothetical protein